MCVYISHSAHVTVKWQLAGIASLPPPCGSQAQVCRAGDNAILLTTSWVSKVYFRSRKFVPGPNFSTVQVWKIVLNLLQIYKSEGTSHRNGVFYCSLEKSEALATLDACSQVAVRGLGSVLCVSLDSAYLLCLVSCVGVIPVSVASLSTPS